MEKWRNGEMEKLRNWDIEKLEKLKKLEKLEKRRNKSIRRGFVLEK